MATAIIQERLAKLDTLNLDSGGHENFEEGHCAMELVAWLAGEPHSDTPACACPVIARFVIRLNDRMPADLRTELLRPLLPRIVGSRVSREVQIKRAYIAANEAVHVFAPMALEKRGRLNLAEKLRGAPEIVDRETALKAREIAADAADAAAHAAYAAAAHAAAAYAERYLDAAAYAAADAAAAAAAAATGAAAASAAAHAAYDAAAAYAATYAAAMRTVFEAGVRLIEKMLEVR